MIKGIFHLDSALEYLFEEVTILKQLLYRNNNQHGKVKAFSYLRELKRNISLIDKNYLYEVKNVSEEILKYGNQRKITSIEFNSIISCTLRTFNVVEILFFRCLNNCIKASHHLLEHLACKVFAPLYTTIYVMTTRLYHCISVIIINFFDRYETLIANAKHYALRNTKFDEILNRSAIANNVMHIEIMQFINKKKQKHEIIEDEVDHGITGHRLNYYEYI